MENTKWIVVKKHYSDDDNSVFVIGVYDNEADAIDRVNEAFDESEDKYIENYGGVEDFVADNHNNGYAELHLDCGWDETIFNIQECEVGKPIEVKF